MAQASRTVRRPWDLKVTSSVAQLDPLIRTTAMQDAAKNPGGASGAGIGMGMGMAMGQQIAQAGSQPPPPPGSMATSSAAMQGAAGGSSAGAPPPLPPQAAQYYLALQGKQAGPFDMPALQLKVHSNELTRETLAWRQGMPQWTPAAQVPELASLFAAMPPPLPPQG